MRVWHLDYGYLDSRRLVSQHNEVHGLTTVILKGNRWGQVSEQFKYALDYLEKVHSRCVSELKIREDLKRGKPCPHGGTIHTSPYPEYPGIRRSVGFKPTGADFVKDTKELRAKWEAEGYHFGTGRLDLRILERELGLPVGRDPKDCQAAKLRTNAFVREHRPQINAMGSGMRLWEKLRDLGYQMA